MVSTKNLQYEIRKEMLTEPQQAHLKKLRSGHAVEILISTDAVASVRSRAPASSR